MPNDEARIRELDCAVAIRPVSSSAFGRTGDQTGRRCLPSSRIAASCFVGDSRLQEIGMTFVASSSIASHRFFRGRAASRRGRYPGPCDRRKALETASTLAVTVGRASRFVTHVRVASLVFCAISVSRT